jgi:hypothetical protein
MTDDPEHEADARLADALSRLHGEVEPPPGVEDRLVTQLRARGDIAGRRRVPVRLIAAGLAAVAAAVLVATMLRRPAGAGTQEPQFLLLIAEDAHYSPPADSSDARARVAEYTEWAGRLAGAGRLISAGELAYAGTDVRRDGMTPSVIDTRAGAVSGYFLVHAESLAQAEQLAADSPHLKYGGTVVVRPVVH